MPTYYVLDASHGPRIEQTGLRYGNIDAETPDHAITRIFTETNYHLHVRIEVFSSEADYKERKSPLTSWENPTLLTNIVSNKWTRKKFEEFFVGPL